VLDVYGSLLYAGSRTLQARLPDPRGSQAPVVVLRLRGRTSLGATFMVVAADYATKLEAAGGRLYLSGVDPALLRRISRVGRLDVSGPVRVYEATDVIGESTLAAFHAAEGWLVHPKAHDPSGSAEG
jgi:SulP family sulfate permease